MPYERAEMQQVLFVKAYFFLSDFGLKMLVTVTAKSL